MALHSMTLYDTVWDDVANTATLTFQAADSPTPPPGGEGWWPGPGVTITMTVSVRKATVTNPTGIQLTNAADGTVIYTKFEYQNGAWVNLGRVNPDGSPWTGS